MKVISHNFQNIKTQRISDEVEGTSNLIKRASELNEPILFCGVLYMAEDLTIVSNGKIDVFIPEIVTRKGVIIKPRCPMEMYPLSIIQDARNMKPDYVLAYINMSATIKANADVVYNGTEAIRVIADLTKSNSRLRLGLIGDRNVNYYIGLHCRRHLPYVEIMSVVNTIKCPVHEKINIPNFIAQWNHLREKWGAANTGMAVHSEVSKELIDLAMDNGAYIGGTTGLTELLNNSVKPVWLVAMVEPFVERLRISTGKDIVTPDVTCPHMEFTQPGKVKKALEIISNGGPVADVVLRNEYEPSYQIHVHRHDYISRRGELTYIPAIRLSIDKTIRERAKRGLVHIIGSNGIIHSLRKWDR